MATPYIIHRLGREIFGTFAAISSWTVYLSFLDLGVGGAITAGFISGLAKQDKRSMVIVFAEGLKFYLAISVAMVFGLVLLGVFLPVIIKAPDTVSVAAWAYQLYLTRIGLGILALSTIVSTAIAPGRLWLAASQNGAMLNSFLCAYSAALVLANVTFAYLGWGIIGQFVATLVAAMAVAVCICWASWDLICAALPFVVRNTIDQQQVRRTMWRMNWQNLWWLVGYRLTMGTDLNLVGVLHGPGVLAEYQQTQRLIQFTGGYAGHVSNSTWAPLAELHAKEYHEHFRLRFLDVGRYAMIAAVVLLLPSAFADHRFVRQWMGESMYVGNGVVFFTTFVFLMHGIWFLTAEVLSAIGRPQLIARFIMMGVPLQIASGYLLNRYLGVVGLTAGVAVSFTLVHLPAMFWLLSRVFHVRKRALASTLVKPFLIGLPIALLTSRLVEVSIPDSWLGVGLYISVLFGAVSAGMCAFCLTVEERVRLLGFAKRRVPYLSQAA